MLPIDTEVGHFLIANVLLKDRLPQSVVPCKNIFQAVFWIYNHKIEDVKKEGVVMSLMSTYCSSIIWAWMALPFGTVLCVYHYCSCVSHLLFRTETRSTQSILCFHLAFLKIHRLRTFLFLNFLVISWNFPWCYHYGCKPFHAPAADQVDQNSWETFSL